MWSWKNQEELLRSLISVDRDNKPIWHRQYSLIQYQLINPKKVTQYQGLVMMKRYKDWMEVDNKKTRIDKN